MPAGEYTLTACAAATVWNNNQGNDNREGISLFLSDGTHDAAVPVTSSQYAPYTVSLALDDGEAMQLGLRAEDGNANTWAFLANVRLYYKELSQPNGISKTVNSKSSNSKRFDLGGQQIPHTSSDIPHFFKKGIYVLKVIK